MLLFCMRSLLNFDELMVVLIESGFTGVASKFAKSELQVKFNQTLLIKLFVSDPLQIR